MLIVISDEKELSVKASFVVNLIELNSKSRFLHVFTVEDERLREIWCPNKIQLAASPSGILMHLFLMTMKPQDLRDEVIRRIFAKEFSSREENELRFTYLPFGLYPISI